MTHLRRQLVALWVAAMGVMAGLVAVSLAVRSGGDDVDQARQRPGILDLGELPVPAPDIPGVDISGRIAVVFVAGRGRADLCQALSDPPEVLTEAAIVVISDNPLRCAPHVVAVEAPTVDVAGAFGLPKPRDGGRPIGYAIVDAHGLIRYRTLDPRPLSLLEETATMVKAVA